MEIRNLPVKLTESETLMRGEELARTVEQYKAEEAAEKDRAKKAKEGLLALRTRMETLSRVVDTRVEHRDIPCGWAFRHADLTAVLHRRDTGEIVETRPMTMTERQERLPGLEDELETH